MDIRERLKKKLAGEIDAEEDFRKYQQRVMAERKEQEKQLQQEKLNKVSNYQNSKKTAMKQIGTQIKEQNEAKKQLLNNDLPASAQIFSANINLNAKEQENINNNINLLTMIKNAQEAKENNNINLNNFPSNIKIGKSDTRDINILNNPKIDIEGNKMPLPSSLYNKNKENAKDIVLPVNNLFLGAVQGTQNTKEYITQVGKKGAKVLGSTLLNKAIGNKKVSDSVSNVIINRLEERNPSIQKFEKERQDVSNAITSNIENTTNPISKKIAELSPSIGSNIVSGAVSSISPLAGTALFMTSAGGSYLDEAKQRGMNDDQALGYATVMGIIEGGSEAIITGKMASNLLKATTGKQLTQAYMNSLKNDLIENFIQESATTWISEGASELFGGQSDWGNWEKIAKDSLESGIDGVLSALIMQGAFSGISSAQNALNKINSGEKLTEQEVSQVINDLKNKDIKKFRKTVQGAMIAQIEKQGTNLQQGQVNNTVNTQTEQENIRKYSIEQEKVDINRHIDNLEQILKYGNLDLLQMEKIQTKIDQYQLELMELENTQETLYNNNESESGINGEQRGNTNGIQTSALGSQKENAFSIDKYKQEETRIRNQGEVNYTDNDKKFATKMQNKYNKKTFIFDDTNTSYGGGLSYIDNDTIMFGRNALDNYGYDFLEGHEILEDINKNHKNIAEKTLNDLKQRLQEDTGFGDVFLKYIADMKENVYQYYINKPELVAKEIIGDLNGLRNANIDYSTLENYKALDSKLVKEIQEKVLNLENIIYSKRSTNGQRLQLSDPKGTSFNSITSSNENVKPTDYSMQNGQKNTQILPTPNKTMQDAGAPKNTAQEQNISYNLPIDEKTKSRKHYKSIVQSQYITDEAKKISKDLMKTDTYVPESNNKQLERADRRIELAGADSELESLLSRAMTGGNIKADDIAVGERLIQYYSKTGNKAKLQDAIQATAMAGTTAGQTVQALSLLNHQTPEGQAVWLQRSVEKMNNDLKRTRGEKAEQFNLTPEMTEKIVNSKNNEELQNNLNDVYKELGQQVTKTIWQKIDSWRYFAMLANPRTHIRNIVGNVSMAGVQTVKNKIAGGIEAVVNKFNPEMERTHTIIPASEEIKQFAKNDIKNVSDRLGLSQNKYNPKTRLENSMKTFKTDALEKTIGRAYKINDNALETEDGVGLKHGYVKALSEYMTANKLTPENITDKQLSKARNYAVEQARQATFHQDARLASLLNQLSNKNKFSKFMLDAIVPYKKTPINIAKEGMNYSPVGLVYHATMDIKKVRNGEITVNQYIDNVSKGLTGTGIALVGYALASAGILSASGSDDEDKQQYEEALGNQTYSIKIGDNTYSLDWIAPSGIPLFIGAEIYEIMQQQKEIKTSSTDDETAYNQAINSAVNILDAFTNAMNPMTEMSMLSGLSSALKSYEQGASKTLAGVGINATKSYINQFIPTALRQIAKTTDEYERTTTSTKTGTLPKAVDSTKNYIMSSIPGLRQLLPIKTDPWGNQVKQSENVVQRALENSVFPWTRKEITTTKVDNEIISVYNNTGESSVLPDNINKNLTINKQKYLMTSEEYAKYQKEYGKNSYNLLNKLVNSTQYKKLKDSQKQIAIEKVYEYAKEQIKIDYAKNNNLNYEESRLSETLNALKKSNANTSNYLEYIALTKDMDKTSEKITVLASSDFTDKTKQVIYENYIKSENDSQYGAVKASGMNITEYLKFKTQEFESDKKDDGTLTGQSVSNSKKKKIVEYLNSMKITGNQRLLLYAMQGYTTTASQKTQLANYVQGLDLSKKEKLKLYDKFSGFTVYKNGTVRW